jgi:uncharacterized protein (TIGR02118 family)
MALLTRGAGMTREPLTRHWLEVHAPLAHAVPGLRRYVQSHIIEEYRRSDIPTTPVGGNKTFVVEEKVII